QFIDRGGFTSKEKLIDWLYDNARLPASEYWDYQLIQNYIYPRATFGEEPWASQLKALPEELIPMFRREDIHVVVVGGETNGYWRIMGCNYQKTVSVDDWRRAMALRKRFGVMVPSTNTTFEADFQLVTPPEVTVHGQRLWLTNDADGQAGMD